MRVLHCCAGNLYGGIETMLVTIARCQQLVPDFEHQFALCFPGRLHDELLSAGATTHELGAARFSRPWTVWRARRKLRSVLERTRFDAIIMHGSWPHALLAPAVNQVPIVCWAHNADHSMHWLDRRVMRNPPALVIANSNHTKELVSRQLFGVPAVTIHCPVQLDQVHSPAESLRQELGIPADVVVIVQVSRMEAWKGHMLLLEALTYLKDEPQWTAWIVGGAQRPKEQRYCDELVEFSRKSELSDRVRFFGQRSDVPSILAAADIFCQPNLEPEPFGICFVEALAAGLPVVTTKQGGAAEIVTPDCGVLVAPDQPRNLADALRELIQKPDLRSSLGRQAPRRAAQLCDPQQQLEHLREVLQELAESRVPAPSHSQAQQPQ